MPTYQGVIVHTVTAVDYDLASELHYSLVSGDAENKFTVDPQTGAVSVQDPKSLRHLYSLVVKVGNN